MSDYKETVTTSEAEGVKSNGAQVREQTTEVTRDSSTDSRLVLVNGIWFVIGLIEVLLAFRFAFKLFGASPSSSFVDFIYSVSGVLTAPFDGIFGVTSATAGDVRSVFEPSILVAAAVYALIGWGIVKLVNVDRAR